MPPDPFAVFEKTIDARRERRTSSTGRAHAGLRERGYRAASCARPSAACSGRSSTTSSTSTCGSREHGVHPLDAPARSRVRNRHWFHMVNDDVISMPDKWEYPWYAAWDLAFHAVALAGVDPDFAKHQLNLMLKARYQHSNGQLPAYEWNFGDVNPPVHAWATLFQYRIEQAKRGEGDLEFLKRAFGKLLVNFTWWVNRKDRLGKSVFEGGFLGLDNIGVFDRSAELPTGGHLEQADGTAWMAMFCQNMLEIAVEIAAHDPSYDDLAYKFAEHFLWIGAALNKAGNDGMWDEEDGFYYDVLRLPDGSAQRLKVRSLVGLLPLCATTIIDVVAARARAGRCPGARDALRATFRSSGPASTRPVPEHMNADGRTIAAVVGPERSAADPLAHARRSRSSWARTASARFRRWHEQHPYVVTRGRQGIPGLLSAGRIGQRHVRRQLQLARSGVVPDERPAHSRALPVPCLLRRRLPRGVSDRLRQADEPPRGREGDLRSPAAHFPARRARPASGVRRHGTVPEGPALARLHSVPRVLPRRQRRRPRRQPPDRVDGPGRRARADLRTVGARTWSNRRGRCASTSPSSHGREILST